MPSPRSQAKGETALYDSLVRAASLIDQWAAQQRYVVLLSDGGDTVSSASLDKAVSRVKSAGAPVYAVALSSPEYNPRAVKALARGTRGTLLSTRESDKLTDIFKAIAEEIQTTWLVAYRSADPAAPDLEITLKATSDGLRGKATAITDNPSFEAAKGQPWNPVKLSPLFAISGWGIAILAGLAVGFAVAGTGLLLRREGTAIDQLQYYDQLRATRMRSRRTCAKRTPIAGESGRSSGMLSRKLPASEASRPTSRYDSSEPAIGCARVSSCICTFSASPLSGSSFSLRCACRLLRWRRSR